MLKRYILILLLSSLFTCVVYAQNGSDSRLQQLRLRLDSLSGRIPGLNQKVDLSITGVPLSAYLRVLGKTNNISFQVESTVNATVNNTLHNVTATNILLLLASQFNLDIVPVGDILVVRSYAANLRSPTPAIRSINVSYRQLDNTLSMELNNDSLVAVARKITMVSGKNVVVPSALLQKTVSAFISNASFDTALEKLAYSNELKMVKTNDNFYLFQPLEENEQLYVNGDRNTSVKRVFKPVGNAGGASLGLFSRLAGGQKLISVHATNASIADLVRSSSQELGRSYFVYSEIKGSINSINANDLSYENFLALIFKGTEYTYNLENGVYMIGERKSEGLRANKAIVLQNRQIDTVVAMIPDEWKRGIQIKELREQNTILLSGSKPQIEEVAGFIKQIDVLIPQVLIEVTLIDVRKNRRVATGISAGVADSVKTGGTLLSGVEFTMSSASVNDLLNKVGGIFSVNLGRVTPNFYLNVSALEAKNNVEVRSVPKLATLNGHTASLSIGNTVYYREVTQNLYPSATTNTSIFNNQFKESKANLMINIKPLVSGDEQVTLGIDIDISDFTSIPTDGSPPPKSTSKFETILRAHNEDMIVLGGIERTENSDGYSGVPLLSRVPLLKWLFSSKNKSTSKVVTLVFIKPTIIR